jgi:hypothetical protein
MAKMGQGAGSLPWMKDLRKSLDGCYAYQADEAEGALSWFRAKEEDDRGIRERVWLTSLRRFRPAPIMTGEEDEEVEYEEYEEDEYEESNAEGQKTAQSDSPDDEAAAAAQHATEINKMKDEETQPSAEAVGGPKKQSFGRKTKDMVAQKVSKVIKKIQFVVETAARLKSRASALGSPSSAQETDDSEHQQRTEEAAQSEKDALDAEDEFQETLPAARDVWQKELRERVSKQADRQMGC